MYKQDHFLVRAIANSATLREVIISRDQTEAFSTWMDFKRHVQMTKLMMVVRVLNVQLCLKCQWRFFGPKIMSS